MKSILFKVGAAILVVALIAYVCVEFFLGSIVAKGVNRFGPQMTKTRVELKGAHISPFSGSGTLTGLFVGNPKGWSSEKAFSFGKIHVQVSPRSFFGDHVVVEDVTIDGPEFVYETRIVTSNIAELLKNIQGAAGGRAGEATTKTGKPIKFEIRHFRLRSGSVTVGVGPAAMTLPMAPIELSNIGSKEGGVTSGELALAIMRSVAGDVVQATTQAAGKIGSTLGAATGAKAKQAGESLKALLGGGK